MSMISYIVLGLECRENIQHSTMSITKSALFQILIISVACWQSSTDLPHPCVKPIQYVWGTKPLTLSYFCCVTLYDFFFSRHSDKFIRACLGWVQQNICLIPVSVLTSWILPCEGFPFFKVLRIQSGLNLGISLCIVFYVLGVCHLQGKDFASKDEQLN